MKASIFLSLLMISGSLGLQCYKENSESGNIEIEECAVSSSSAVCMKYLSSEEGYVEGYMKGCQDRPDSGYGMNMCKWSLTTLPDYPGPAESKEFNVSLEYFETVLTSEEIKYYNNIVRCQCNTNLCNGSGEKYTTNGSTVLTPSNLLIMLVLSYVGFVCLT